MTRSADMRRFACLYKLRFIPIEVRPCHCGRVRTPCCRRLGEGGVVRRQVQTAFALPYICTASAGRRLERREGLRAHVAASVVLLASSSRRRCRGPCHILCVNLVVVSGSRLSRSVRAGKWDGSVQPRGLPGLGARCAEGAGQTNGRRGRTFDRRLRNCSCRLNDI